MRTLNSVELSDRLAQTIRIVDGNHDTPTSILAEKLYDAGVRPLPVPKVFYGKGISANDNTYLLNIPATGFSPLTPGEIFSLEEEDCLCISFQQHENSTVVRYIPVNYAPSKGDEQ